MSFRHCDFTFLFFLFIYNIYLFFKFISSLAAEVHTWKRTLILPPLTPYYEPRISESTYTPRNCKKIYFPPKKKQKKIKNIKTTKIAPAHQTKPSEFLVPEPAVQEWSKRFIPNYDCVGEYASSLGLFELELIYNSHRRRLFQVNRANSSTDCERHLTTSPCQYQRPTLAIIKRSVTERRKIMQFGNLCPKEFRFATCTTAAHAYAQTLVCPHFWWPMISGSAACRNGPIFH